MPKEIDDCVKALMEQGKTKEDAFAICNSKITKRFADTISYSSADKTAISVRDGVLEYMGSEIGVEPADKVFTVYRSPATIANVHPLMVGIPLTDEHISLDDAAPDTGSYVFDAKMIDAADQQTATTIAIKNKLSLNDAAQEFIEGKRELSLGYFADLVPHDKWDYEQINIVPHHLAAVPEGRCGSLCSFLDRKPQSQEDNTMLHKAFEDADGAVNLEQVVEIAASLPEAIRKVPVERLTELMPAMVEIMSYAKEQGAMPESEMSEEGTMEDEAMEEEMTDGEMEEDKKNFSDSKKFKDAVAVAQKQAVKEFAEVHAKASQFLDSDYSFIGKTAKQVMRDAIATQTTEKFADSELPVAFKMLKKTGPDYSNFGKSSEEGTLSGRIKKDLEEG